MIEDRELLDFHETLKGEVETAGEDGAVPETPLGWDARLAEVILGYMEESGYANEPVMCPHEDTTGRDRCRVVGYSVRDDGRTLDLYTAAFVSGSGINPIPASEISRLTGRAARFFRYAVKGALDRFDGNQGARDAAEAIHDAASQLEDVRVFLLTNGRAKEYDVDSIHIEEIPVEFSIMDIERLFRSAGRPTMRADIQIDFREMLGRPLPALEVLPTPDEYETYLAIFPGELIYKLYETYGPRLLEFNVRSFLQARGKVNQGIRNTLRDEPERFLAYNNGLTATVDEIEVTTFHGQTSITRITGLQIVNGGQTTASIHRAKKQDKLDVSQVAVAVKLTRVEEAKLQEFVPLISKFSNTQNVIQVSDLSANHEFHIALERLSETVWCPGERQRWFYERSRGGYQVAMNRHGTTPAKRRDFKLQTPPANKFSKTDAAKYIMTWLCRPHDVSRGGQKNFSILMNELEELLGARATSPDECLYRELVAKAVIFKAAQRIVRQEGFPAYRANIVTYLVAYLAHRLGTKFDLEAVWEEQCISTPLEDLLRDWSHEIHGTIMESAGDRNVTEWCKKLECWGEVKSLDLLLPDELPPEVSGKAVTDTAPSVVAVQDETAAQCDMCMAISASDWAKIATWGRESGRLRDIEWQVASTLATYAMAGWQKQPSNKQLRFAVKAVEMAKEAGVVSSLSQMSERTSVATGAG